MWVALWEMTLWNLIRVSCPLFDHDQRNFVSLNVWAIYFLVNSCLLFNGSLHLHRVTPLDAFRHSEEYTNVSATYPLYDPRAVTPHPFRSFGRIMCLVETQAMAAQPPSSPHRPQNGQPVCYICTSFHGPSSMKVFEASAHLATDIWAWSLATFNPWALLVSLGLTPR